MRHLDELLGRLPLPETDGDKHERGTAVVVAGAPTCPGAALLVSVAALRAGAGRVQVVTDPSLCPSLGVAMPEAFVGGWRPGSPVPAPVAQCLEQAAAVVVGPGLDGDASAAAEAVAEHVPAEVPLLLDARAIPGAAALRDRRPLVLPNEAEAVDLLAALGAPAGDADDLVAVGERLQAALDAPVAVRGETTVVVGDGTWTSRGDAGLGTAGSGDVLVGVAVGLLARGLEPLAAIGWAVGIHATAGRILGEGRANPGYLARELADAIPSAIARRSRAVGPG